MNIIQRAKELDKNISDLKKIIDRGEYVGAGIALSLTVGKPQEDKGADIDMSLSFELEPLLRNMLVSMQASRDTLTSMGRSELRDLQAFFGESK
jgi:hypothetical protein